MKHVLIHARSTGRIRRVTFEGREHIVVPVVALMEGVIHASNAPAPEFVPLAAIEQSVPGWDGRPVMLNHPERNGEKIYANDPAVLERESFGRVFGAHVAGNALHLLAYLDVAKAERVPGAAEILARLLAGTTVEVSAGATVQMDPQSGRWRDLSYHGRWTSILPDHLALLTEDLVGACSVAMGCGALRANAKGQVVMCDNNNTKNNTNDGVPPPPNMRAALAALPASIRPKTGPMEAAAERPGSQQQPPPTDDQNTVPVARSMSHYFPVGGAR